MTITTSAPKYGIKVLNERSKLIDSNNNGRSNTNSRASSIEEAAQESYGSGSGSGSDSSSSNETKERSWKGITCRQYIILGVLMVATMTSSFAVCLFPPFFPKIAEEKGCSATVYGFIIGTNCLTSFIVTPFIGKNVSVTQIAGRQARLAKLT